VIEAERRLANGESSFKRAARTVHSFAEDA
jgi:hypothetical protein